MRQWSSRSKVKVQTQMHRSSHLTKHWYVHELNELSGIKCEFSLNIKSQNVNIEGKYKMPF